MLAVDYGDRPVRRFEIVEQSRIDRDAPRFAVPRPVGLKVRAVGV